MEGMWIYLLILLVFLLLLYSLKQQRLRQGYPSGPFPLPFIGGLWRIGFGYSEDTLIKGTFINPNLNSALLDPKQWETPEKFNPNHFLDKSGKFVAREEFQLFGSGDPTCLEEQLARIELFSFFSALLKAFRFRLPGGEKKLNTEPRTGLTTYPHSYQLCALPHCQAS